MGSLIGVWFERDVVRCTGRDAVTFLQGQLSQDIAAIALGASRWSLLLQPQGKVESLVRVSRTGDAELVLDTAQGHGEVVLARLQRFKLRVECELEVVEGWRCLEIRSVEVDAAHDDANAMFESLDTSSAAVVSREDWSLSPGIDLVGPQVVAPDGVVVDDIARQGVERLRIRAGVPRLGAELDESTIPAEAGQWLIERTVSFTKGCYVGQELVARVDSRGSNTPRKLRRLRLAHDASAVVGAEVRAGDELVGVVTSVADVDALAYVKRSVDVGAVVTLAGAPATVEALPAG